MLAKVLAIIAMLVVWIVVATAIELALKRIVERHFHVKIIYEQGTKWSRWIVPKSFERRNTWLFEIVRFVGVVAALILGYVIGQFVLAVLT